ncbi:unnamed protein product, partial [marine sediment metagenome]
CRACTGEGQSQRSLYTDEEDVIFAFRRCVGMNGIGLASRRADLLDRSIVLRLPPLDRDHRADEQEMIEELLTVRPIMLGAIFSILSGAMPIWGEGEAAYLATQFRMVSFARWGYAIGEALGGYGHEFVRAYADNTRTAVEAAIELNPFAQAILSLMQEGEPWQGTASELLARLCLIAAKVGLDTEDKLWPKTASWVTRRLSEIQTELTELGVGVKMDRTETVKSIRLMPG